MNEFVVLFAGKYDIANARDISDRVARVLANGVATRIVLDLKRVSFLDFAGIRNILYAKRPASAAGREFQVCLR